MSEYKKYNTVHGWFTDIPDNSLSREDLEILKTSIQRYLKKNETRSILGLLRKAYNRFVPTFKKSRTDCIPTPFERCLNDIAKDEFDRWLEINHERLQSEFDKDCADIIKKRYEAAKPQYIW